MVIFDFFRLIRPLNLFIIVLTQFAAAFFLSEYETFEHLLQLRFLMLVAGTVCIAAAGYILNDYLDVKLDMVNKPAKVVVGKSISRRWAMVWHIVFNAAGLLAGILISLKLALLFFFCALLLWIYSSRLKKMFFSGNLAVASLSALCMLVLPVYDINIRWDLNIAYASFAFLITLVREIIKDIEDMKGDARYQCKTLPIVLGLRPTKQIVSTLMWALVIALLIYASLKTAEAGIFFLFYCVLVVLLPMLVFMFLLQPADKKTDFSRLSSLCKGIMFSGILSMIFFRL